MDPSLNVFRHLEQQQTVTGDKEYFNGVAPKDYTAVISLEKHQHFPLMYKERELILCIIMGTTSG